MRLPGGLRARVIVAFSVGGLLLSTVLALVTYQLANRYLVAQRERSAERQTWVNARALRAELRTESTDVPAALAALEIPTGSSAVLGHSGDWFGTSVAFGRSDVPSPLRDLVRHGGAGIQRAKVVGETAMIVGVPIPAVDALYFEVHSLSELAKTLEVIRNSLFGAAIASTLAAALLGWWSARRVLEPLRRVSNTAVDIAHGELSRRLESSDDRDLDPLTRSFNEMVEALQHRIERDARFASDVSHELRSPLTTMAAAADVLEARSRDIGESAIEPLALLIGETRRFERLVSELLELARAEADVDVSGLEAVNLAQLVLHVASDFAGGAPLEVRIDPALTDTPVLSDKRRLRRVLVNLVENAQLHGGDLAVVTITQRDDASVLLVVEDSGNGIAPEERPLVFQRFFRGAAAGRRQAVRGSGLGLALVAEHIRVLGGEVSVDASSLGGARFIVELPYRRA